MYQSATVNRTLELKPTRVPPWHVERYTRHRLARVDIDQPVSQSAADEYAGRYGWFWNRAMDGLEL